jgi:aspartate carbamoyltransferase catalytic subunit
VVIATIGLMAEPKNGTGGREGGGLLGLEGLSAAQLRAFLALARDKAGGTERTLAGKIIANLFFEDSTRTRTSFSIAAKRLGADVVDLGSSSSVNKGESLIDTARNIEAMGVSGFVVRARQSGAAAMIASAVKCPVVNAGDGRHEHPTQGLLDIYTIAEAHGRLDRFDLSGLKVLIVGDVVSSRVARSNIAGLKTLGAEVVCAGPVAMAPRGLAAMGCTVTRDVDSVIGAMDAVMMLRIQFERYGEGKTEGSRSSPIASVREYRELFGLTAVRAAAMKKGAIVMHPGPINRGIEMDAEVADGERSVILRQVANGVLVRMAVLERVCGG